MVQAWRLPESIVQGVTFHHDPATIDTPIAYAVHLADVVAKAIGAGLELDNADAAADTAALAAMQVRPDAFGALCQDTAERYSEVLARFG
jgi:HD-like signal output (HDOD) protein